MNGAGGFWHYGITVCYFSCYDGSQLKRILLQTRFIACTAQSGCRACSQVAIGTSLQEQETTTQAPLALRQLILLLDPHGRCSFNCPYCFNVMGRRRKQYSMFERHTRSEWLEALGSLQRPMRLMVSGLGEPLLLKEFRAFCFELSEQPWVSALIIFTNGSTARHYTDFHEHRDKIRFNLSLHPTELAYPAFLEALAALQEAGLLNAVNTVAYKFRPLERIARSAHALLFRTGKVISRSSANLDTERLTGLIEDMRARHVRVTIQGIDCLLPPYTATEKDVIMSTRHDAERPYLFREPSSRPGGVVCGCGTDFVLCDHHGNLCRCSQYIRPGGEKGAGGTHGNLFAAPRISPDPQPCDLKKCSVARQEYAMRFDNCLKLDEFSNVVGPP